MPRTIYTLAWADQPTLDAEMDDPSVRDEDLEDFASPQVCTVSTARGLKRSIEEAKKECHEAAVDGFEPDNAEDAKFLKALRWFENKWERGNHDVRRSKTLHLMSGEDIYAVVVVQERKLED